MRKNNKIRYFVFLLIAMFILASCQSYHRQVIPFKMPQAYPNSIEVAGTTIAARLFEDSKEAESVYGFDILGSGILPIQIIFDNRGEHSIEVIPSQTFLVDINENIWPILESNLAYERIVKKTEYNKMLPNAGKAGLFTGVVGGIIGAAIGIAAGVNVGDAALTGAALGAAAGLAAGGTAGIFEKESQEKIREDLKNRTLENRAVLPHQLAYGFIFFPGESAKPKELRLNIKDVKTGTLYPLIMRF